jgi:hypothetical protein
MASLAFSAALLLAAVSAAVAQNVPGYWNGIPLSSPTLLTNVSSRAVLLRSAHSTVICLLWGRPARGGAERL